MIYATIPTLNFEMVILFDAVSIFSITKMIKVIKIVENNNGIHCDVSLWRCEYCLCVCCCQSISIFVLL